MYSIAIVVLLTALCLVLDDIEWSLEGKRWKDDQLDNGSANSDDAVGSDISDNCSDQRN